MFTTNLSIIIADFAAKPKHGITRDTTNYKEKRVNRFICLIWW
jgi:hypothetical protein